ncbi:MAG: TolC family protein [Planctomycetota bacterium]
MLKSSLLVMLFCIHAGCSASYYSKQADEDGLELVTEKRQSVDRARENLLDPRDELEPREKKQAEFEVPAKLDLDDAVRLATLHNRGFETRREAFFLQALSLDLTRRDFLETVFSGSAGYTGSDGRALRFTDSAFLTLSGTRLLPTGGRLTVTGAGNNSTLAVDDGTVQDAGATGIVTLTQPLLRGAGRKVAFEPLTQAERTLLYEARDFEFFRETFAVDIIEQYYNLVRQKQEIANEERRLKNQEFAQNQAKALYAIGTQSSVDVQRAEQSFLDAQNSLLDTETQYRLSLDRFKIQLGVPTDTEFEIGDELPAIVEFEIDMERAVQAALHNRLDLRTTRDRVADAERALNVSKNNLLPDLDLDATYTTDSAGSDSLRRLFFDNQTIRFGVNLEIPLDRKAERNQYKSALITLDRARRTLRREEDSVILEIRGLLRALRTVRSQLRIGEREIDSLVRQATQADLENRAGLSSNRDKIEALDELTEARNRQLSRTVNYEVARLRFIQALGLMFVDEEGRIVS